MTRGRWDLDDYGDLLDAVAQGGYRYAWFGSDPEPGVIFLRHDVDLSLDAARQMARFEAQRDIATTYLLMTESIFYNLASAEGRETIAELRELGHRVGLHAVYPNATLDGRFEPVVAWHNPEPAYMTDAIGGAINVMGEPYFSPEHYRSDSNQHWRSGCPHEELRAGAFRRLQLLTHPEIWVFPGSRMGETMRAMLEEEKERRLDQLAADRIDLS